MKKMRKALVGVGVLSALLVSSCQKTQDSNLTLSGLNPANFEEIIDSVEEVNL